MTAMYCPECGNEALVSEPIRWPYECRYCGTEMKYLRLPNVVLRRRESKRPPGSDKSKAAGKK